MGKIMGILTKIFWILVLIALVIGIHAGYMFGKPVMNHKLFVADAEELMNYDFSDDTDVRKRFIKLMNTRNIPMKDEYSLEVEQEGSQSFTVYVKYSKTVDYFGFYQKTHTHDLEFKK